MDATAWDVTAPVALGLATQLPRVSAGELLSDRREAVAVLIEQQERVRMSELSLTAAPALPDAAAEIAARSTDHPQPPVHPWTLCVRADQAGLWGRGFVPVLADGRYLADSARNIEVLRGVGVPIDDDGALSRLPAARREAGTAVVIGAASAGNYFHWLFESVGRLGILEAALPNFVQRWPGAKFLVPRLGPGQQEILTAAGVPSDRVVELRDDFVVFDRLIIPSRGLGRIFCFSPAAASFLRSLAPDRGTPTRRVYLTRKHARRRRIVNEPELVEALERRQFVEVEAEQLEFDEQLELFSQTSVLVSAHGAGLGNQVFMPPGGTVIEIQPPSPGYAAAVLYWSLGSTVHHRYAIFIASTASSASDARVAANADIEVEVDAFTELVDRVLR